MKLFSLLGAHDIPAVPASIPCSVVVIRISFRDTYDLPTLQESTVEPMVEKKNRCGEVKNLTTAQTSTPDPVVVNPISLFFAREQSIFPQHYLII